MNAHPRVSVSAVCSFRNSVADDIELWKNLGVTKVGLTLAKLERSGLEDSIRRVNTADVDVTNLIAFGPKLAEPATWPAHRDRLLGAVEAAHAVDADCLGLTTGSAGHLRWEDAAEAFAEAMAPVLDAARAAALPVVVEHTNSLRVDVGFVHTLRDMVDLARACDVGVLCEVTACWYERGLIDTLKDGVGVIGLVQISDFVIGTHDTPNRAVPGDGDIPLRRFIGDVLDAGYAGVFDLEIIGPRIEEEGYESAVRRSVDVLSGLLSDVEP